MPNRRSTVSGFTLIEMLVVIGIIALLTAILLPVIFTAQKKAKQLRVAADLQSITTGLEAYKLDFGDFPPVLGVDTNVANPSNVDLSRPNPPCGALVLCRAMLGVGPEYENPWPGANYMYEMDGAPGPGFRSRPGNPGPDNTWGTTDDVKPAGKVYGPYLKPENFKLVYLRQNPNFLATIPTVTNPKSTLLAAMSDYYGNPIQYFPGRSIKSRGDLSLKDAFTDARLVIGQLTDAATPVFRLAEATKFAYFNDEFPAGTNFFFRRGESNPANAARRFSAILGDYDPANPGAATNFDGKLSGSETSRARDAGYLLWSAGPDGLFGVNTFPVPPITSQKDIDRCDDVINFGGQ